MRLDEFLENRDQYRQDDNSHVDDLIADLVEQVGRAIGGPGIYEYEEISRLYDGGDEVDEVLDMFDCCWLSGVAGAVAGTLVELHKEVTKK